MAEAACRTTDELYDRIATIRALPGVARTEMFVYLKLLRQSFQWNREVGGADVRAIGAGELDPLDIGLIRALQRDGRASFREIGRQLGMSERSVSARYVQLVEMNPVRATAVVNPLTLGWSAMAWLGVRVTGGAGLERAAAELGELAEVSYLVVASGRYDLMAEVVCRTPDELLATLTKRVGSIEAIASVDLFPYLRLLYPTTAAAWSAARSLRRSAGTPLAPTR